MPANQVLHIFRPTRLGQVRDVSLVTPALVKLYFLDQYDDAELDRKKLADVRRVHHLVGAPRTFCPMPPTRIIRTAARSGSRRLNRHDPSAAAGRADHVLRTGRCRRRL
ncbi:phage portal protein [Bradyrhizobium sp. ORS 111]|uniref:phage portal protein n=1 Tax=Bradyrhizobium sp. ORS 111 TaxID=1685958 RepID=UPI00388D974D